jgi:hypothetical protein
MSEIKGLTINEAEFPLENKCKGKIAVFIYIGELDPKTVLDTAVINYVDNCEYIELIDSKLDNPWMRVIISGINDMKQELFNSEKHKIENK